MPIYSANLNYTFIICALSHLLTRRYNKKRYFLVAWEIACETMKLRCHAYGAPHSGLHLRGHGRPLIQECMYSPVGAVRGVAGPGA